MTNRRGHIGTGPNTWVPSSAAPALEVEVDFDLDLNGLDDPNAGFIYVEADTEPAVFDARPCDPAMTTEPD